MKSGLKWGGIAAVGLIAYVVFEELPESRKNAIFVIVAVFAAAYCVMDYVNTKHRETALKLNTLQYTLDQFRAEVPNDHRIAEAVSEYAEARAREAERQAGVLNEVNSLLGSGFKKL